MKRWLTPVAGTGLLFAAAVVFMMMPTASVRAHGCTDCTGNATVVICHRAGQAGTTQAVTLQLPCGAAQQHIGEQGTPAAGHEEDTCGPCGDSAD